MPTTKIIKCECDHKEQDKIYGTKQRLHNQTKQNTSPAERRWRCTVCQKEKS